MPAFPLSALPLLVAWLASVHALDACAQAARGETATHQAQGFHFTHHDWELACDNTRTCRAAGYQADDAERPVSLLLTREAGAAAPVRAQLTLGDIDADDASQSPVGAQPLSLRLRVNGQQLGALPWLKDQQVYGLNPMQLRSVIQALPQPRAVVEVFQGDQTWRLSDRGAHAVLLKMDEAQGRLGTPEALVRKGARPEGAVLPPLPAPVVKAVKVPAQPVGGSTDQLPGLSPVAQATLQAQLVRSVIDEHTQLSEPDHAPAFSFHPLGGGVWLASTVCWTAAYNQGSCMWLIQQRAPHRPVLITDLASDYQDGVITASHKGRGIGDCWGHEEWTWDGRTFVHTRSATTGLCKLVTAGGAWDLPTLVARVVRP